MAYRSTDKTRAHMARQRRKLLDAALTIVSNQGFTALSIVKVATRSGLAVGSVYKHFNSKDQLLLQVYSELSSTDLVLDLQLINQSSDAAIQLNIALDQFFAKALMADKLAYALFAEPISPLISQQRQQYKSQFITIFSKIISQGIEQKIFCNQDITMTANAIVGILIESLLTPMQWQDQAMPTFERIKLIQQCQQFCLRAVMGNHNPLNNQVTS